MNWKIWETKTGEIGKYDRDPLRVLAKRKTIVYGKA
jgi:hypothetical protein